MRPRSSGNEFNRRAVDSGGVDSLEKRGIPVEYVLFPDEGHGFRKTSNRITSDLAIAEWFDEYLNGQLVGELIRHSLQTADPLFLELLDAVRLQLEPASRPSSRPARCIPC